MITPLEIAREYFPNETDAELENIVWSHTGYPCFFRGKNIEALFRRQLMDYKYFLIVHGNKHPCDCCGEKPGVEEHSFMQCKECGDQWDLLSRFENDSCAEEKAVKDPVSYKELHYYFYRS